MPPPPPPAGSGYAAATGTYRSPRPAVPLPPPSLPLSFPSFAFSLLPSPLPSRPAFISIATGAATSFPDFLSSVNSVASFLRRNSIVAQGDVVFVLSPPVNDAGPLIPALYFALLSLGAVVSPANPASTPSEISRLVELSRPAVAFTVAETAWKLPAGLHAVFLDSPEFLDVFRTPSSTNTVVDVVGTIRLSDPALIMYTSGTTGRVKGAVLTHRNLIAATAVTRSTLSSTAVTMITVPLFHIYGFLFSVKAVMAGETAVLLTERFNAVAALRAVERFRVTCIALAPPTMIALVRARDEETAAGVDLSSLRAVSCGGAPLGVELIRRFVARYPKVLVGQGYGMTETTSAFARLSGPEETKHLGSAGRLNCGCEAKIVDTVTGIPLPPCNIGELHVRGPFVMEGYIGDQESTSAIITSEGWLKTGDLCYIDNDGFIYVVDRLKELIKYKGYQVPPAELEHLLQTHPDIVEASVVAYPDEEAGEVPVAFVVTHPGHILGESEIKEFVNSQVSYYKRINRVFCVNQLPKTATGKVLRKDLTKLVRPMITSRL